MRPLGSLIRLQIQRSYAQDGREARLGPTTPPRCSPCAASRSRRAGVLGAAEDGGWIVDVHHMMPPGHQEQTTGCNGVSVGFTAHYGDMRQRFGERLTLGCAGENLIAETAGGG